MKNIWRWVRGLVATLWHWLIGRNGPFLRNRCRFRHSKKPTRRVIAPLKPKWVHHEVIRLKALMPQAGASDDRPSL